MSAVIELNHLGYLKTSIDDVMKESIIHLIGACYGQKCDPSNTMSSVSYEAWVSRTRRKGASILPKLKSQPPTTEAYREPPELDPLEFGYTSEGPSGAYCPMSLPSRVEVAPSDILINCICSTDRIRSSQRRSCSSA